MIKIFAFFFYLIFGLPLKVSIFFSRLGYQMVAKPIQNTVVIDLSTTKSLANCLDETQTSSLKVRPCFVLQ
jgi:hypothetical protein